MPAHNPRPVEPAASEYHDAHHRQSYQRPPVQCAAGLIVGIGRTRKYLCAGRPCGQRSAGANHYPDGGNPHGKRNGARCPVFHREQGENIRDTERKGYGTHEIPFVIAIGCIERSDRRGGFEYSM